MIKIIINVLINAIICIINIITLQYVHKHV